ncbi:hypothetical protein QQG74_09985 [Micromonospora sp. FIMYZ51]|uniref:hypothetical protein n=1 Tax=Micromonospora sp. FIMYZ51 TaxID=3051832 RepID=UPI00311F8AE6
MSARVGLAVGGFALAVSVTLAAFGWWLLAVALQMVPAFVAGRWERRRAREAADAALAAAVAEADRLRDELDSRWVAAHAYRFLPDDRPDWPAVDCKPAPTSAGATSPVRPFSTA